MNLPFEVSTSEPGKKERKKERMVVECTCHSDADVFRKLQVLFYMVLHFHEQNHFLSMLADAESYY